ncbi:hypothetical protein C0J52_24284, partial [Blattella germanica]
NRRVAIARKKKIYLPEYYRLRAAITWKYQVGIQYINYAQETFSFPFFRDLEFSIILIGMVKYTN